MKRILINATQREELRVGIVDGQKLYDLDIELASREQRKSNVYKGKITRVEPSLEACFVDYGAERHGFLPLKEIHKDYYRTTASGAGKGNMRELIAEGSEIIVQVEKEERGNKGAALTTYVSLAGRYLVLMPNNPKAGGISRRAEGEEREEAREALAALAIPDGMGIIVRTNGMGRSAPELQTDLDQLADTWGRIVSAAVELPAPFPLYKENNVVLRALRDYLRPDIGEVIVDNAEIYEEARAQMLRSMPAEQHKLKLYRDDIPLFSRYQVESQIESAHERMVRLPSGGSIVIDHTEALTAIDINSAKATGGGGIEETALQTNLEAADEIARQLRLRDLGGLIVIDFIDMNSSKNQRDVEKAVQLACDIDRARVQVGRLSRFGLLEMSRQRLRPSLSEHTQIACPRCEGRGQIRSVESLALAALRLIEEECMKDRTGRVIAQLPVDVATYLLNEKRGVIAELESRYMVVVTLVPNETLETPKYEITRIRADHLTLENNAGMSYRLPQDYKADARAALAGNGTPQQAPRGAGGEAAVKLVLPNAPAPLPLDAPDPVAPVAAPKHVPAPVAVMQPVASGGGFWNWLKGLFGGGKAEAPKQSDSHQQKSQRNGGQSQGQGQQRRDGGRGDGRREGGRPQDGQQRRDGANRDNGRSEGRGDGRNEGRGGEGRGQRPQQEGQQRRDGRGNNEGRDRNNEPRNGGGENGNRQARGEGRGEGRGDRGGQQQPRQPQNQPKQQNPRNQQPQANAGVASSDAEALPPVVIAAAAATVAAPMVSALSAAPETMDELLNSNTPVDGEAAALAQSEGQAPAGAAGEGREGGGRRGRRGRRGRGRGRNGEAGERNPNAAPGSEGEGDEGSEGDDNDGGLNQADDTSPMFDSAAIEARAGSDEPGYAPRRDQRPQRTEVVAEAAVVPETAPEAARETEDAIAAASIETPAAVETLTVLDAPIAVEPAVEQAAVDVSVIEAAPAAQVVEAPLSESAAPPFAVEFAEPVIAAAPVDVAPAIPVEVAVVEPIAEPVIEPIVEATIEPSPVAAPVVESEPSAAEPDLVTAAAPLAAEAEPVVVAVVEPAFVAAESAPPVAAEVEAPVVPPVVIIPAPAELVEAALAAATPAEKTGEKAEDAEKKPDATA
ncbi:Rne/Rng family ribonuclease [Nevskia ramosa]|uniref:Rne/Rng family ribonuclease n=1 Tax=Nevskia ramosa TaxID=64002 RepID=UPI0003B5DEA7|nr:Rne/Rng family ribonuclease [Nevskia ramosa]